MVLPEDSDNAVVDALNKIHEALEDNNSVLTRIANHYDGVVPVMTRNAKRVEKAHVESESNGSLLDIFKSAPREQGN
tara:strand:- start:197 stop:427 length:231 start_codon:yes stop_codon:yes gene_type:complete